MEKITLTRFDHLDRFEPLRITGELTVEKGKNKHTFGILESRKYIFPPGIYTLEFEWSPKFKRCLWEFKDIPNRSEIKIHGGTKLEHTKGCPLIRQGVNALHYILDRDKTYKIKVQNNRNHD